MESNDTLAPVVLVLCRVTPASDHGMPRMTLRLRYRILKTSRAVLGLALGLSQLPAGEHQV